MRSQGAISRAALGRMASVGDLYDARTDNFCCTSIFKRNISPSALKIQDADFSDVHLMHSDTFTEKFFKLDVKAELSVSVLAGLFTLEGSGRYLGDQKKSSRTVKSSLVYNIQTKDEKLNIYHEDLKEAFAIDAIENGEATHVVTGISWGANSVLSCTYENKDNKDVKVIEGSLAAQMKKVSWSIAGKASVDFSEGENDKSIQFDVRVFGDVLPKEDLPTTFEGALQFMKQVPSLIANCNEGKGKPLTFRLVPISLLKKYLNFSIMADTALKTLEEASMTRVVHLFDEISRAQQELYDFNNDAIDHKYCVMVEVLVSISSLKKEVAVEETSFRSKLAAALTDIRSGKKDASEIENLLLQFRSSPASPENVALLLKTWESHREKILFAKNLQQNGAKYIGLNSSLDKEMLDDFDSKSFVLFFSQKSKILDLARWNGNRLLFYQEMKKKENGQKYYVVDCDIHPDHLPKNTSSIIQVIQRAKIITDDLLQQQEKMEKTPMVNFVAGTVRSTKKTNKGVPLTIPCTGINCDPNPTRLHKWICRNCFEKIEYGFDDHVYCNCGKTPLEFLEFKCTDPRHGLAFEKHDKDYLEELISKVRTFKELNILVIGETGEEKSNWINGFLNLVTYGSLKNAEAADLCSLVPPIFTVVDENFDEIEVKTGTDNNEVYKVDASATKEVRIYPIYVENTTIRLIDTTGIGNILRTLSNLEDIHGICILLKPNNARLNLIFGFCIKELFTYLHREASKNIIFCFLNSRKSFYRPGVTMPSLKGLLNENKNVEITVSPKTVYCFDSEAYRFLAAVKNNPPVKIPHEERENFSKSWEKSLQETHKMLDHIKSLPPHPIRNTFNYARELVLKAVKPLAEMIRNNLTNITILEDKPLEIQNKGFVPITRKQIMINENAKMIREYRNDIMVIQSASVIFAYFLKLNAITPCNDAMETYLNHLINEEQNKMERGGNRKTLDYLSSFRDAYRIEKEILATKIEKSGGSPPTAEEILKLAMKLKRLKHSGETLKKWLDYVNHARSLVDY